MKRTRVLIMDDLLFSGLALSECLGNAGYTVQGPHVAAESVREVVAITPPDIAILQVEERPDAALDLCRDLIGRGIKVIVITRIPRLLVRASDCGAVTISGPVKPGAVERRLARHLQDRPSPEPA